MESGLHWDRPSDEPWYGSGWLVTSGCFVVCAWLRVRAVDNKTHHHEAANPTGEAQARCILLSGSTLAAAAHTIYNIHTPAQSSEAAGKGGPSASLPEDDDES